VGEAEAELGGIQAETQRMTQERQRAAAGYDAEAHGRLEAATRAARTELASVGERLRLNGERRAALQRECEQLRALESDLETARQAFEADSELLKLTQQMRRWVSEAGPHVTRALVQEVARQAAQIYCEIMNDFTLHLHWDEHYEIKIEKAGHTRTFRQLSGGEQMAAAIAVRLALLKQVSNIDIAFFDEPTANLDETRRTSLADQIVNVRGFSQIFVISHDDTFERVTDHIVRVYKEADVSRVEVQ
jgi:exonuclease SbcC